MQRNDEIIIEDHNKLTPEMKIKLDCAIRQCLLQMRETGLVPGKISSFSVNFRAKRWGLCTCDRLRRIYSIQISSRLLEENIPEKSLRETILHELCHTIRGGGGHTGAWKNAVTQLNRKYGYNIKRVNSSEEKGVEEAGQEKSYRYELQCTKCGQVFRRQKKSALVEHPGRYRCRCGGKIVRLK